MGNKIVKVKNQLALVASAIETVSPISVLDQGYSIVTDAQGKIVSDADQLKNKDKITTRFAKNSVTSIVKKHEVFCFFVVSSQFRLEQKILLVNREDSLQFQSLERPQPCQLFRQTGKSFICMDCLM